MPRLQLIEVRQDTATHWATVNPVLTLGEPGYDTTNRLLKIGDGVSKWNSLAPISGAGGSGGSAPLDASDVIKGVLRLNGDLSGTADLPTVPGLASKVDTSDSRLTNARTPLAHGHATGDVTGLDTALAGKAASLHGHATSDVTGLDTALAGKAASLHGHATGDVTGLDTALADKAAAVHTHDDRYYTETEMNTALAGKANTTHGHATGDVTGLDSALAGKAAAIHGHVASDVSDFTEVAQDVVGAMVTAAGGTYNDVAGTITLPASGGATDHGALTGLGNDDHLQYHNDLRGDARYYTKTAVDTALTGKANTLGVDDNYVTDAEKVKLTLLSGTNTGDQVLPTWTTIASKPAVVAEGATQSAARTSIGAGTSSFSGIYTDLTSKPTLGDSAAKNTGTAAGTVAAGDHTHTAYAPATQALNAQVGTAYTLVAADAGKIVTLNNAAAITLTVPSGVFTAGQRIDYLVLGAGMVTVIGSGTTVNGTPSLVSRARYSAATVICTAANTFVVVGDLA